MRTALVMLTVFASMNCLFVEFDNEAGREASVDVQQDDFIRAVPRRRKSNFVKGVVTQSVDNELTALIRKLQSENADLRIKLNSSVVSSVRASKIDELNSIISSLENSNRRLKRKNGELKNDNSKQSLMISDLQLQISSLEAQAKVRDLENQGLQNDNASLSAELVQLQGELAISESENSRLQSIIASQRGTIASLRANRVEFRTTVPAVEEIQRTVQPYRQDFNANIDLGDMLIGTSLDQ